MTDIQPAFFAFWADRWLAATNGWTAEEKGIYFTLLIHQFTHGSVPNDTERLARIAGCSPEALERAWEAVIRHKFSETADGLLVNERMQNERRKAIRLIEQRREAGVKGGRPRKNQKPSGNREVNRELKRSGGRAESNPDPDPELSTTRRKKRASFDPTTVTDDPTIIAAALAWQRYRAEAGYKAWGLTTWKRRIAEAEKDPRGFAEAIEHSISQGYQGVFPPKKQHDKKNSLPKGLQTLKDWHDNSDF